MKKATERSEPLSRSEVMRAVRSTDTSPEMQVRKAAHRLGFRYRLYRADLPGKPDLVFSSRKKVIFVHGCFWHGHSCKRGARVPHTNTDYWTRKISRNRMRDAEVLMQLSDRGWSALVIWECEIRDSEGLAQKLLDFLTPPPLPPNRT